MVKIRGGIATPWDCPRFQTYNLLGGKRLQHRASPCKSTELARSKITEPIFERALVACGRQPESLQCVGSAMGTPFTFLKLQFHPKISDGAYYSPRPSVVVYWPIARDADVRCGLMVAVSLQCTVTTPGNAASAGGVYLHCSWCRLSGRYGHARVFDWHLHLRHSLISRELSDYHPRPLLLDFVRPSARCLS